MEIVNRKANFNYFVIETYECGIELLGNEVKSMRAGSCTINDSYGMVRDNEIYLVNMFVKKYKESSLFAAEETRRRKLLLHKNEILKIKSKIDTMGYTIIPLKIYLVRGKFKVLLGICKGKKNYDKRETLKERDIKRNIERELKG